MKIADELNAPGLLNIILADDDKDDCFPFDEALKELPVFAKLTTVANGVPLMQLLSKQSKPFYDVHFLDLNMPQKNGFTCLKEIKVNTNLKQLSVIILSTSCQVDMVDLLYKSGADFYIRKPSSFSQLKNVIQQAITLVVNKNIVHTSRQNFVTSCNLELNDPA